MGQERFAYFCAFKSEPPSGRNPKWPLPQKRICTHPSILVGPEAAIGGKPPPTFGPGSTPTSWSVLRPPSGASPLPHLDRDRHQHPGRPRGRDRGQAPSHIGPGSTPTILVGPEAAIGGKLPRHMSVSYQSCVDTYAPMGPEASQQIPRRKKAPHSARLFSTHQANQLPLTALPSTVPSCSMMLYSLPSVST